jgi:pimeloyl-ACP methyl ester carboxylesterase
MSELEVRVWGSGPRVVLVHGGIMAGAALWSEQQPLAERWRLEVLYRRGYGQSPPTEQEDFAVDAQDIADLLGDGAHLVGHSYGGVGALLAAALRPQAVLSLTMIEPPAFGLASGNPAVDALAQRLMELRRTGPREPEAYVRVFFQAVGMTTQLPSPLPPPVEQAVRLLMTNRGPWEAEVPLVELRRAAFPKLVVSGGHHPAYDAVCDVLERELRAERAVIPGAGHMVPRTGAPFNARLESFLRNAS